MKVLMLTPSYNPIIGGTETVVKNLAINLNKIGIQTDVMTFNMDKKWEPRWKWEIREEDGFKVYRIPAFNLLGKIPNPIELILKVHIIPDQSFRMILNNYDILHLHDDVDLTFPVFSYFVKRPKVFQCHTLESTFESYRKNVLSKYLFKHTAEAYTSFSDYSVKLLYRFGIPKNKINLLPNGVDIHKFRPTQEKKTLNLMLFVGRIQRLTGLHVLLNSLLNINIPVHLTIIGPNYSDSYFKEILKLISKIEERSAHKITYMDSISDIDLLVKWYQKASVFVWPSLIQTEAFGVVTAEALSCETPVVASSITSHPKGKVFVKDRINGMVVRQNDSVKLAESIQYLLDNEDVRIRFGKEGRKHVVEHFSWEAVVERFRNLYKELIR